MLTFIFISYLVLFCIAPYTIMCFLSEKMNVALKKKKMNIIRSIHHGKNPTSQVMV